MSKKKKKKKKLSAPRAESRTQSSDVTSRKVIRRYFQRREPPAGWWPWGLLPLLGLLLLFLWGMLKTAPDIQASTRDSVASVLAEAGFPGLDVTADGQIVRITGQAAQADIARIRGLARGATCDALVGDNLVAPTRVVVDVTAASSSRPHDFVFARTANQVVLRGEVPDTPTRQQMVAAARQRFGTVVDSLRVTQATATAGYPWAAAKAWDFLGRVTTGHVNWTNGVLSASGQTTRNLADGIRQTFAAGGFPERIGDVQLSLAEESIPAPAEKIDECNERFRRALQASQVRFQSGSATISADSHDLLQQLADVAQSCPGVLAIEGHTDSVGNPDFNRTLSQQRAQAVVEALVGLGVEVSRLRAVGYGEDQPLAPNSTLAGRAQNRRIEIKVSAN